MLPVLDGVDESVFELFESAKKLGFDKVHHGEVLAQVVLEGSAGQNDPAVGQVWSLTLFYSVVVTGTDHGTKENNFIPV